jgi:EPS-associated MarR family transcriptional regulator
MTPIDEATRLQIMRLLADNPELTQRELAEALGISLGSTHYCLRALIRTGLVRAENFRKSSNRRRHGYFLTPIDLTEKSPGDPCLPRAEAGRTRSIAAGDRAPAPGTRRRHLLKSAVAQPPPDARRRPGSDPVLSLKRDLTSIRSHKSTKLHNTLMPASIPLAIIGLGYVGLPHAVEFAKKRRVIGFDTNAARIAELEAGRDSTLEVEPEELRPGRAPRRQPMA